MSLQKRSFIVAGGIIGLVVLIIVGSLLRLYLKPQPSKNISIWWLEDRLNSNYPVTATIGDETYRVENPKELKLVLEFDSWEETDQSQPAGELLFELELNKSQQYVFYSDGYIYVHTYVTENEVYISDETQYKIPAELAQEIFSYLKNLREE